MATVVHATARGISLADRMATIGRPTSGFDYMRLALSLIILIWHSFLVTNGLHWAEGVMFSPIGVIVRTALPMFFALSGFLVAGSLERNASIPTFAAFRAFRILPALAVEISLSAILIGALTTTLATADYYGQPQFATYFLNIVGWIHYNLPGVFAGNPDDTVNRSLWTIPSELECYLFLIAAAAFGLYKEKHRLLVLTIAVYGAYIVFRVVRDGATPGFQPHGGTVLSRLLIFYFMTGVLFYRFRDRIPFNFSMFVGSMLAGIACLFFEQTVWLSLPATVYATVYLGLLDPKRVQLLLGGDYSYGIYLYAYPIQQTWVWLLPNASWYVNLACALPTTAGFAVLSWHWIEKPALRLKTRFGKSRTQKLVAS